MNELDFIQRVRESEQMLYRISCTLLRSEEDRRDALQETALKAWQHRGRLREEKYFSTWLVRILINTCKKALRARARRAETEIPPDAAAETPDEAQRLAVEEALAKLPEKIRLAVVLHYMEGFPLEAAAKALGVPVGTVKSRLARGRELLRLELE